MTLATKRKPEKTKRKFRQIMKKCVQNGDWTTPSKKSRPDIAVAQPPGSNGSSTGYSPDVSMVQSDAGHTHHLTRLWSTEVCVHVFVCVASVNLCVV